MSELHRTEDFEDSVPWNLPHEGQRWGLGADSIWPFVAGTLRAQRPDQEEDETEDAAAEHHGG